MPFISHTAGVPSAFCQRMSLMPLPLKSFWRGSRNPDRGHHVGVAGREVADGKSDAAIA